MIDEPELIEGQDLENLQYGNKKMDLHPTNISLGEAITRLYHGEATHIDLQPGDATRYQLYLIPCWNPLLKPGNLNREDAKTFIVLSVLNLHRGVHLLNLLDTAESLFYTLSEYKMNNWSRHLLSSFVCRLGHELQDRYGMGWYNFTPAYKVPL